MHMQFSPKAKHWRIYFLLIDTPLETFYNFKLIIFYLYFSYSYALSVQLIREQTFNYSWIMKKENKEIF